MQSLPQHTAEHHSTVAAPPEVLYDLVLDVAAWPVIFRPTVHVEHLERRAHRERFQIWALVNDSVATWTSRRMFDRDRLLITFKQERSQAPVASMRGYWKFRPLPDGRTEVTLGHRFTAVDNDPEAVGWIERALDGNSVTELANLRTVAELDPSLSEALLTFQDTVRVEAPRGAVYDFIADAGAWPGRLPHVRRVELTESQPGVQLFTMDTVTADGSTHTTRSVRVCQEPDLIVYKQVVLPALLMGHSGRWSFADSGDGSTLVTAMHSVAIKHSAIGGVLGTSATLADAKAFARDALGGNSRTTLGCAKAFAEAAGALQDVG